MANIEYTPALPWLSRKKDPLYGQCLAGITDLTGGMATGRRALAESLARATITEQGTNIVDPDDGYDVEQHLYGRIDAAKLSEISASLTTQFMRDDRVRDAQVEAKFIGGVLLIAATIFDGDGPFPLTLSVSEAGVTLLKAGV